MQAICARRRLARELGDLRAAARLRVRRVGDALRARAHEPRGPRPALRRGGGASSASRPRPTTVQGRRNLLFREGCDALGISSEPIARNVRGCRGSGECFTGCRARAKQSMDISYVPAAIRAGARVYTSVRAEQVLARGAPRRRACAAAWSRPSRAGPAPRSRSTRRPSCSRPAAWRRRCCCSEERRPRERLRPGRAQPPVPSGRRGDGRVPRAASIRSSAPRRAYQSAPLPARGLQARDAVGAARGARGAHARRRPRAEASGSRRSRTPAIWDAIASCHRSLGTVRPQRRGSLDPVLTGGCTRGRLPILGRALGVLGEMLFAAGARKVLPGVHGIPDELRSPRRRSVLRRRSFRPHRLRDGREPRLLHHAHARRPARRAWWTSWAAATTSTTSTSRTRGSSPVARP